MSPSVSPDSDSIAANPIAASPIAANSIAANSIALDSIAALAIHTASPQLGLAARQFSAGANSGATLGAIPGATSGAIRCQTWNLDRRLSADFHGCLQEFVGPGGWRSLRWLAVAIGPGGFTGTRIGVVAARTLAQQLDIPLFGISTLAAAAWTARDRAPAGGGLAVSLRARRGQICGAVYRCDPEAIALERVRPETVLDPADWRRGLADLPFPVAALEVGEDLGKDAIAVLELAQAAWDRGDRRTWESVLPYYGQSPVD